MLADRHGTPLAVCLSGADEHDSPFFEPLLTAVGRFSPVRPRKRPKKVHADKNYDYRKCRQALHRRAIKGRIARRGKDRK